MLQKDEFDKMEKTEVIYKFSERVRKISLNVTIEKEENCIQTLCTVSMPYKHLSYSKCSKGLSKFNIRTIRKLNNKLDNIIVLGKDKFDKMEKTEII